MTTLVTTDRAKLLRSKSIPPLTAANRCDKCGSRAYVSVLVRGATSYLDFCAHHFNQYSPKLAPLADLVRDERKSLVTS
jgi:hypothetical protein